MKFYISQINQVNTGDELAVRLVLSYLEIFVINYQFAKLAWQHELRALTLILPSPA